LTNWVKINLFYLGSSKKHEIFRIRKWTTKYESILKKAIFSEAYDKIGKIEDIFGPITNPFISVKLTPDKHRDFELEQNFYVKI